MPLLVPVHNVSQTGILKCIVLVFIDPDKEPVALRK